MTKEEMRAKEQNPFYHNYIFSLSDLQREKIRWWQYPLLWFRTEYVQIGENHVFHFKLDSTGRIFLMKIEMLPHDDCSS